MNFIFGFEVRISLTLEVRTEFKLLQSMSRLGLDRIFQKQIKRMILHHSCMLKVYCPGIDLPESLKSSKSKNYCQMMKYDCFKSPMPYEPYDMAPMISYDKQNIGNRMAISYRQFYLTFLFSGESKTIFSILKLQVDGTFS